MGWGLGFYGGFCRVFLFVSCTFMCDVVLALWCTTRVTHGTVLTLNWKKKKTRSVSNVYLDFPFMKGDVFGKKAYNQGDVVVTMA